MQIIRFGLFPSLLIKNILLLLLLFHSIIYTILGTSSGSESAVKNVLKRKLFLLCICTFKRFLK